MTQKKRILVDCDGVMADFSSAYLNVLEEVTGRQTYYEQITSFHFEECIATAEEDAECWRRIKARPGFVLSLSPEQGLLQLESALALLRELGQVVCVTSPVWGSSWADERYKWLTGFGFDKRTIVFASDKSHVHGDVLIDDAIHNLDEWHFEHAQWGGRTVCINQPWNARPHGHTSCNSLSGAAELLKFYRAQGMF